MNATTLLLLACSLLLFAVCGAAILWQRQAATRMLADRLETVTVPFMVALAGEAHTRRPRTISRRDVLPDVERLLGYDRSKRSHRSISFWPVTAVCAGTSLGASWAAQHVVGPVGWFALPAITIALTRTLYHRRESQYCEKLFRQFPDALGMIVRAVRVGVGVGTAIAGVASEAQEPTQSEFGQLAEEIAIGLPLPDALRAMSLRSGLPEYQFFAAALTLQNQTGGGLSETLETLADTIRKRVAVRMRGHALAAEARISCYVLGALPFVIGFGLLLLNPGYIQLLYTDPQGQRLLLTAVALLSAGLATMHIITKRTLR